MGMGTHADTFVPTGCRMLASMGEGERALLRTIRERAGAQRGGAVRVGIGDDAAVLALRRGTSGVHGMRPRRWGTNAWRGG
jgi:hypothetical protein